MAATICSSVLPGQKLKQNTAFGEFWKSQKSEALGVVAVLLD